MGANSTPPPAGCRLTVDLDALQANWRTLSTLAPRSETAAVVKADAYGIGIEQAGAALAAAGCRTFFVALAAEGMRLRQVAPAAAIYVLNGLIPGSEAALAAADLRPVLGSPAEIERWAAFRPGSGPRPACAFHVDTGMNRLGLTVDEAGRLSAQSSLVAALRPSLVMSHLACADRPGHRLNAAQLGRFRSTRLLFPGLPASLANSAGIWLSADYHFDVVRPGIALYGAAAADGRAPLRPVVTAEAMILQIRDAPAGATVGYGATERVKAPSRIAVLSVGYADGYHRRAGSSDERPGARVHLHGRTAPLVGRVSMDLAAVDVTAVPEARPGDFVELFGARIPVDEVAARAETIGYELLTGLGRRYRRRYVGADAGADEAPLTAPR